LIAIAFVLVASIASAQPSTQPLVQQSNVVYLGSFTLPTRDGSANPSPIGNLTFGGVAGMGADGQSLYYTCSTVSSQMARISIPALGGVASVLTPCVYIPTAQFDPPSGSTQDQVNVGAALAWNNRLLVNGYTYYDNNPTAPYSLFTFNLDFTNRQGPYALSWQGGVTGQYMGVIPPEWRPLLGGPAASGASALPIITRSSSGPAFHVFDPDAVGPTAAPATRLLAYQIPNNTLTNYNNADHYGGFAFPAGYRSVLYIRRHGDVYCYGEGGSQNPPPPGFCYDPTDTSKGGHAYPYRHEVVAYDANDLAAVKAGTKLPHEVQPYAIWALTDMVGMSGGVGYARMKSSAYDPATRRWYVTSFSGSTVYGNPRVHVYEFAAPTAPPQVPCEGTWAETVTLEPPVCDATQQQIRTVTQTFTRTSGDPATCPASPVVTMSNEPCVYVPPAPTGTITVKSVRPQACDIRVTSTPPDTAGGWGVQFTLDGKNMGTRDTSSPYQRDKSNVATGTIVAGVWSKADSTLAFTIGPVVCE